MSHRRFSAIAAVVSGTVLFGFMATASAAAVDEATFNGWKLYKRERCETCHGPTGEGGAAFPNLLTGLKNITKEQFNEVVLNGRKNMPQFKSNKKVADGIDQLYTYLKGRSDGTIPAGDLEQAK
jgi:mono/diheme cytochrome c family protein